ncbi:unnamed protein product [marine sediment metagenome]|uniref:Uncharacterized protein n=1 Tax=marine sediment metagenome TaxID=412755 RepID=X0VJA1_9ZZZZ
MESGASTFVIVIFLALLVEYAVERLFGTFKLLKGYPMVLIAMAAGVGICFAPNPDVNLFHLLFGKPVEIWSTVATGMVVGGGSDVVHSFIRKFAPRKV